MGKERTAEILPVWEKEKPVERVADFKTLIVYRKKYGLVPGRVRHAVMRR